MSLIDGNPYVYSAVLKRVIDGDTIVADVDLGFDTILQNQKFRLNGINTPESRTRDKAEKVRGLAAKERLIELLGGYKDVGFKFLSYDKGKYGRILADIYHKDDLEVSINHRLLQEGHAVEYYGGKR